MSIKAVLFDLDDTLLWDDRSVQESFAAVCAYASERTGISAEALNDAVRTEARAIYEQYETYSFTQMIGINPFEGLWGHFTGGELEGFRKLQSIVPRYRADAWTQALKCCGVDDPQLGRELGERFAAERRSRPLVYEETFEVLDKLRGNVKLLLLTNGSPDLQQEKLDAVPELAGYFDHIVISGDFGQGKPAAPLFRHAAGLLDIEPEEGLMVGDKLTTDILGSNGIGMPNAWVNRHGLTVSGDIAPKHEIANLRELFAIIESYS